MNRIRWIIIAAILALLPAATSWAGTAHVNGNQPNLSTDVTGTLPVDHGGTGQTMAAGAYGAIKQAATTSASGAVELATDAETQTGTDSERAVTPAGLASTDAATKAHDQNTDTGTTSTAFQIDSGNSGPKIKNNSGVVEIRNAGDTAYSSLRLELWIATINGDDTISAEDMWGGVYVISGAHTPVLPVAVVGMHKMFRASTAAVFSLDPNVSDHFEMFDRTVMAGGEKLTSGGTKNEFVFIYCESANTWIIGGQNGAFVNGG